MLYENRLTLRNLNYYNLTYGDNTNKRFRILRLFVRKQLLKMFRRKFLHIYLSENFNKKTRYFPEYSFILKL